MRPSNLAIKLPEKETVLNSSALLLSEVMTTQSVNYRTVSDSPLKSESQKERIEKQLFKDVQKLIRLVDARKAVSDHGKSVVASYERMIHERCDALECIDRR